MGNKNSKIFPYKIEDDKFSNDMEYYTYRNLDKNFCIDCHQGFFICNDIERNHVKKLKRNPFLNKKGV